jgi:hypothetical protein
MYASAFRRVEPQAQKIGGYLFSVNKHYAIQATGQARVLYVRKGQAAPTPADFFKKGTNIYIDTVTGKPTVATKPNAAEYECYAPKATFEDHKSTRYADYEGPGDCVQYACGLLQNSKNWGNVYPSTGHFEGTGTAVNLGATQAALGAATAAASPARDAVAGNIMFLTANPNHLGQLGTQGGYNFHGAAVVAKDGTDQITSEACVGSGRWQANFYVYDNAAVGASFLDKFQNQIFGGDAPGSVVSARITR